MSDLDAPKVSYWRATRHPAPCLMFVLPLLVVYELGVVAVGGPQSLAIRNGADAWLRWGLELFGVGQVLAAPAIVLAVMLLWSWWRWADRPDDPVTTFFGMAFESGLYAFLLWQFSRNFRPIFDAAGAKACSISRRSFTAVRVSSIATSA